MLGINVKDRLKQNTPCDKKRVNDEKVLVVAREKLFPRGILNGFMPRTDFEEYEKIIDQNKLFLWRSDVEKDISYKQIIPYLIFNHADTYFLMQRRSNASEARLKNKYSLGIGGHIRLEDMKDTSLVSWVWREFEEEVSYEGGLRIHPLGLINEEESFVGQVHTGFVFLIEGDRASIKIKSELKKGTLFSIDQMRDFYNRMEKWSQLVFDFLVSQGNISETIFSKKDYRERGLN